VVGLGFKEDELVLELRRGLIYTFRFRGSKSDVWLGNECSPPSLALSREYL